MENRHSYTSSGGYHKRSVHDMCYYDKDGNEQDVRDRFEVDPKTYRNTPECDAHNRELYDKYYGVWVGHHDAREGIRYKINGLNENGKLLTQWVDPGYISLNHSEDEDRDKESLRRLETFPEHVKQKICYDKIVKQYKNRLKS